VAGSPLGAWIVATALGGGLGFGVGGLLTLAGLAAAGLLNPQHSRSGPEIALVLACALPWLPIVGGRVALAEWLVLRRCLPGIEVRGWIRMNAVVWTIGTAGAVLNGTTASDAVALLVIAPAVGGTIGSGVHGLVSGAALAWMVRPETPAA
jgi:hypothetical protein